MKHEFLGEKSIKVAQLAVRRTAVIPCRPRRHAAVPQGYAQDWSSQQASLIHERTMAPNTIFSTDAISDIARKDLLALLEGVRYRCTL